MDEHHHIRIYDGVMSPEACEALLSFLASATLSPADNHDGPEGHKRFDELFFDAYAKDESWAAVNNRLFELFNRQFRAYVEAFPQLKPHRLDGEGFRFKRYRRGEGQFATHIDQTPATPARVLAAILYLNDVDEGGETEFPSHGVRVQPRAGRMLVAPTGFTHPHRSNTPMSSDKYVINTFAGYGR